MFYYLCVAYAKQNQDRLELGPTNGGEFKLNRLTSASNNEDRHLEIGRPFCASLRVANVWKEVGAISGRAIWLADPCGSEFTSSRLLVYVLKRIIDSPVSIATSVNVYSACCSRSSARSSEISPVEALMRNRSASPSFRKYRTWLLNGGVSAS